MRVQPGKGHHHVILDPTIGVLLSDFFCCRFVWGLRDGLAGGRVWHLLHESSTVIAYKPTPSSVLI
jgi:hypothetical protein